MTLFDRALATDGFSQNRGKEELLMERAHSQIAASCVMASLRCQGKSSQLRGVATWEIRRLLLTSSQGGGKPR